jgi:hypothetical protein
MLSMRYSQFENTLHVMQELEERLNEGVAPEELSTSWSAYSERRAAKRLFRLMQDILNDHAEFIAEIDNFQ